VFQLKPDGTGYLVLRSFVQDFYDGILPTAGLIQGSDGALYGTTSAGGRDQNGTVYSLVPPNVSPVVTCPSAATTLVIFWAVNGEIVRTNSVPASHSAVGTNFYFEAELPLGTNVVEVSASDQATNTTSCSTTVKVVDTTPPIIVSAIASPSVLWPPNHQMVPVNVRAHVTDTCGPAAWKIIDVRSNESVNGRGDVNVGADWAITGNHTVNLRAERAGKGADRIYFIILQAKDPSGNLSDATTVQVTVPKNWDSRSHASMPQ
jgi:uncharacterized repeat protein (TIGR03803 family)